MDPTRIRNFVLSVGSMLRVSSYCYCCWRHLAL